MRFLIVFAELRIAQPPLRTEPVRVNVVSRSVVSSELGYIHRRLQIKVSILYYPSSVGTSGEIQD